MLILLTIILIFLATVQFLIGYAYFNDIAEDLLLWRLKGKSYNIKDKQGYKRHQGMHSILMGIIFLLVPISLYLVETFELNPKILYGWLIVLGVLVILNAVQVRKFFK